MDDSVTLEDALETVEQLRDRNQELAAQIMRLQGQSRQITDVEIRERFGKLYDAIRTWIQGYVRDMRQSSGSAAKFQERLRTEDGCRVVVEMMQHHDPVTDSEHPGDVSPKMQSRDYKWAEWLINQGSCVHVLLNAVLWDFLKIWIFDAQLPPSLQQHQDVDDAMDSIMAVISRTGGGEAAARRWRAHTIEAMTGPPELADQRGHRFLEGILDLLAEASPLGILRDLSATHRASLQTDVVRRAAELKEDMDCSVADYRLQEPSYERLKMAPRFLLESWKLQSVAQWIPVANDDDVEGVFRCLYPRIIRITGEEGEHLEVLQPTMLVYDTPGPEDPTLPTTSTEPLRGRAARERLYEERSPSDPEASSSSPISTSMPASHFQHYHKDDRYQGSTSSSGKTRLLPGWPTASRSVASAPAHGTTTPTTRVPAAVATVRAVRYRLPHTSWPFRSFRTRALGSRTRSRPAGTPPPPPLPTQGIARLPQQQFQPPRDAGYYGPEQLIRSQSFPEPESDPPATRRDGRGSGSGQEGERRQRSSGPRGRERPRRASDGGTYAAAHTPSQPVGDGDGFLVSAARSILGYHTSVDEARGRPDAYFGRTTR